MNLVSKLNLGNTSYENLFKDSKELMERNLPKVQDILIELIDNFPDHPFKVRMDDDMYKLVESIREQGQITPIILRPKGLGYEIISGHRRKKACEIVGLTHVKAIVREMSDEEAIVLMVESNLQRSEILPSEKAFSYKMRLEALKRMPGRPKKNVSPMENNSNGSTSSEVMAEDVGESKATIFRYIRLTELIPELLALVDEGKIAVRPAVELSYLTKDEQILDLAIKEGALRTNPCNGAMKELQRKYADTVKEVKALTNTEQALFEDFLSKPGTYHSLNPIITVMLYTGMRVGEVGGLRWADIDFEKEEIHISHTLIFDGSSTHKNSEYSLNPPKTKSSNRCIPISPRVKEALLNEKKRQEQKGIKCAITINGYSDFVFLDDKGGLFHYKKLNHRLDRLSAAIDAEIKSKGTINGLTAFPHVHSHMLRHTFATRMREAGADIKATADIMGHNEVDITLNTYTDASKEFKKQEISLLDLRDKIEVI